MDVEVKHAPWFDLGHRSVGNVELLVAGFQKCEGLRVLDDHIKELVPSGGIQLGMGGDDLAKTLSLGACCAHVVDDLGELAPEKADSVALEQAYHGSVGQNFLANSLHNLLNIEIEFHF